MRRKRRWRRMILAADDFGVWCVGENRGLVGFYLYFLPLSLTEPELVFCPFFSYF
jgi:hypothetical protein